MDEEVKRTKVIKRKWNLLQRAKMSRGVVDSTIFFSRIEGIHANTLIFLSSS